ASVLVLQLPAVNASGTYVANTWDYIAFYGTGTNLYRDLEVNAASTRVGGTKLLSNSLSSITFSYNNADLSLATVVDVDLTSQTQVRQQVLTSREQQKLFLRNR